MLIELSEFNYKLLIPFIFPISRRLEDFSKKLYIMEDNDIFKAFRYFLSYSLCFIPFLIIEIRTKNAKDKISDSEDKIQDELHYSNFEEFVNEISKIVNKNKKKEKIKNIIFLLFLCVLGFFCYFHKYFVDIKDFQIGRQSIGILFEIIDYTFLSYLILNLKLYKHHLVSAGIIGFTLIILFIITIFYLEPINILYAIIYYFLKSIGFGSYNILGKKYMLMFYKTPYFLIFAIGIINTILLLIYDIITYYSFPDISEKLGIIIGFKKNVNSVGAFFSFLLDIILEWMYNIGIWLTIYHLTPCHYFISGSVSECIYFIQKIFEKKEGFYSNVNIYIFLIVYLFNLFWILIFNEVLILNLCGLDHNTKKRIQEREIISKEQISFVELLETERETDDEPEI